MGGPLRPRRGDGPPLDQRLQDPELAGRVHLDQGGVTELPLLVADPGDGRADEGVVTGQEDIPGPGLVGPFAPSDHQDGPGPREHRIRAPCRGSPQPPFHQEFLDEPGIAQGADHRGDAGGVRVPVAGKLAQAVLEGDAEVEQGLGQPRGGVRQGLFLPRVLGEIVAGAALQDRPGTLQEVGRTGSGVKDRRVAYLARDTGEVPLKDRRRWRHRGRRWRGGQGRGHDQGGQPQERPVERPGPMRPACHGSSSPHRCGKAWAAPKRPGRGAPWWGWEETEGHAGPPIGFTSIGV